jgi:hypothetical protein
MVLTRLEQLLESPSGKRLRDVIRHAREMDDLAVILRSSLPDEAAPHLVAANVRERKELVLICSSSSWAARIRFESDALIAAARAAGVEVDRCSVKIARR